MLALRLLELGWVSSFANEKIALGNATTKSGQNNHFFPGKKNSLEFSRTWNQVLFFRMKSWKFSQKKKKNLWMKDRNSSRHSLLGVACWVWRTLSMTEKVTQTLAVNILVSLFSNCICYYCCSVDRTLLAEEKKKKKLS